MKPEHPHSNSQTETMSSLDGRLEAAETLRVTSLPVSSRPPSPSAVLGCPQAGKEFSSSSGLAGDQYNGSSLKLICSEEFNGRNWDYFADNHAASPYFNKSSIRAVPLQSPEAPAERMMAFFKSYVVPEGFPDSVPPSYVPYMTWRALKHFFGGAIGVFTTQTLLSTVGVSQSRATSGAVAINWILKDGAGRVGKMLFARQGKKFDYELKQLKFAGDLVMELGAGIELATAAFPHLFLPLAITANLAKNVAAVTSTSTRTPIYKAFAKGENIGDVTAKGESIGNIADLLGTGLSIMIAKRNPSLVPTFALLSGGYILSSYQEVKSVVLHTLDRARFTVAVESFLKTGRVPTVQEGNSMESVFSFPWTKHRPIVLGSRFKEAFRDPDSYLAVGPIFEAHVLLHVIYTSNKNRSSNKHHENESSTILPTTTDLQAHVVESYKMVLALYEPFKRKADEQVSDDLSNC